MKSFEDLYAWQVGMKLVDTTYTLTATFPKSETYGLVSQMRRASASIVANIAEGFGRFTFADKANRYVISRGECAELKTFMFIALQQKYITEEESKKLLQLLNDVGKLLSGLIRSCRQMF